MTQAQEIMTIAICVAGTMATRFLPFLIFREGRPVPPYVRYLGKALPSAIFAMLVVYCLKNVDFASGAHGLPELNRRDRRPPPLEAPHAAVDTRRHALLYGAGAVGVLA